MRTPHAPKLSEADYLQAERSAETRHEFMHGELVARASGTSAHAHAIGEVHLALLGKFGSSGCVPTTGDQRIHVSATGLYAYPDVSVFCGRPERHPTDPNTRARRYFPSDPISHAGSTPCSSASVRSAA